MMKSRATTKRRQGYMLVMCLLVIALTSSIALTLFSMLRLQTAEAKIRRDWTVATSLSEAGKEHAIAVLIDQPAFRGAVGPISFATHPDRTYSVQIADASGDISIQTAARAGSAQTGGSYVITAAELASRRAALGL